MRDNGYPETLTQGIALAHIHELRQQAEQERLVRSVRMARRRPGSAPTWPAALVAALRDSLGGSCARRPSDACVACS